MKKLSVTLLVILPAVAAAADQALPAFPDQKIGLPPLSLTEIPKQSPLDVLRDAQVWFGGKGLAVAPSKKFVSKMPILVPKGDIDTKMLKAPDSSTDYKLIVKTPEVQSTK
jgi:hypothetical protein